MIDSNNIVHGPCFKSSSTFERDLKRLTLDEYIIPVAKSRSNPVYLIDISNNAKLMSEEFIQKSYNLAAELQALGCDKSTIVGIMSENRLEYPIIVLGTILTGATITCINPAYTAYETKHVFNIVKPTIIFCSSENYHKIKKHDSSETKFILFDSPTSQFSQMIHSTKPYTHVKRRPNDTVFILYSSGTTGLPKGVMLTHKNIVFLLKVLHEEILLVSKRADNGVSSIEVSATPMFHSMGLINLFDLICRNKTSVIMPKFDLKLYLSALEKYKTKVLRVVPTLVNFLLKNPITEEYDLSSLEFIFCGAAPIKPEIEKMLKNKFKLLGVHQAYGLTEVLGTTSKTPGSPKAGTCGSPLPGVQMKVVHPETGKILGKNEIGEICIKGPSVMKGYFGNDKATAETIDRDEWLHTGDLGYYDDDGDFFIVDRIKELIKYKGFQVAPAEIEGILCTNPAIFDCAVIGIPNEIAGELPKAYVVKRKDANLTEEEIIQYVAERVSPQKRLSGGVEFIEEIPRNSSGKILRRKLRELWNTENKFLHLSKL